MMFLPYVLTAILFLLYPHRHLHRLFALVLQGVLFSAGFLLMGRQLQDTDCRLPAHTAAYAVSLCEHPEEKERSLLCRVKVSRVWENDTTAHSLDGRQFLLYIAKDSAAYRLRRGDCLLAYIRLEPPHNNGNPDEFDYARFLRRKGISGTGYVPAGQWMLTGHHEVLSLKQAALDQRERIVELYARLGFKGDNLAVLSALTVGDQDNLSEEIEETYSVTGASHVLALSGMHIGFLYALFWLLFSPLWKRWRLLKAPLLALTVSALWAFAFFTGLMPSVVRSVVMFSLLALSQFRPDQPFTLNTAAATAFLMLLFRPEWLFDVGFQLSFLAVAGILLIHPHLYALCPSRCPSAIRKVWTLLSVSTAAQVGVAPLIILYFSRFSTHFLLTNLWAVPISSLSLYAAVGMLILTPIPTLQTGAARLTDWLIGMQNDGLRHIERLPYASLDNLWTDQWMALLFYLLILLTLYSFHRRTARSICLLLGVMLVTASYHSFSLWRDRPQTALAFYNINNCPAVHCLSNGPRSWIVCADSTPDTRYLQRSLAPHWNRQRLSAPHILTCADYTGPGPSVRQQIVTYAGKRICLLNDNRWNGKSSIRPLRIDYLYVTKGYRGDLRDLSGVFRIDRVVIDSSLPSFMRRRIIDACALQGIPYTSVSETGAVKFLL